MPSTASNFTDARRERLFLSSVAFFLTFAIVRAITYAIHAGRGPLHDVVVGGMHLHHLVLGILLLLGVGYLWLAQVGKGTGRSLDWPLRITAPVLRRRHGVDVGRVRALAPTGGCILGASIGREYWARVLGARASTP